MNEKLFWNIIQQTVQAKTQEEQINLLLKALRKLTTDDVRKFKSIFEQAQEKFSSGTSLEYMLGDEDYYFSDDSWLYFTNWLIMQGKSRYEQALHTPEEVLPLIEKEARHSENFIGRKYLPWFEEAMYVTYEILEEKEK